MEDLELVGGAWGHSLSLSFFPDYGKHNVDESKKNNFPYEFNFEYKIIAGSQITYLSAPTGAETVFNADKTEATIKGSKVGRSLRVFYRSALM